MHPRLEKEPDHRHSDLLDFIMSHFILFKLDDLNGQIVLHSGFIKACSVPVPHAAAEHQLHCITAAVALSWAIIIGMAFKL